MKDSPIDGTPLASGPLTRAVLEIDEYAAGLGWDQPARLFALVDTARLSAEEPELAGRLASGGSTEDLAPALAGLTPVEQEALPEGTALDEFLGTIAWPDAVTGCALTLERLMLPASVEESVPEEVNAQGEEALSHWVAGHPERQEVRMTVAVLRGGGRECAVRLREKDSTTEVLTGANLVPGLAEALASTFLD